MAQVMTPELSDFLLGFGSIVLTIQITALILLIVKKRFDNPLALVMIMIALDLFAIVLWIVIFKQFTYDYDIFKQGLALSIFSGMLYKITKFLKIETETVQIYYPIQDHIITNTNTW